MQTINDWKLSYIDNKTLNEEGFSPKTSKDVLSRLTAAHAEVPGNFELDLMREGILPDLYYGTNTLLAQRLENLHLYYFTEFDYSNDDKTDDFLVFEGIDTIAEIFLDGVKIGRTENMLHSHEFALNGVASGKHDLLVHVLPTVLYARQFNLPAMCFGAKYNSDSLFVRKAPYMFGWDIMPRIVSGGLWKPVVIKKLSRSRLKNPFTYTERISNGTAYLNTALRVVSDEDYITDYSVSFELYFGETCVIKKTQRCFASNIRIAAMVNDAKLWYPKNYGEQNLYTVRLTLLKGDELVDSTEYNVGIRTVKLSRTSCSGDDGDFCFIINGKRVFCLGTNWVPTDAFPSKQKDNDLRGLNLLNELGCNMIRCWGGNIYPDQTLYDFCDKNGIMIWQDFSFGCGHYPDDEFLCRLTKEEIKRTAITYRNHPSLVLWAGDNECDVFICQDWERNHSKTGPEGLLNPNDNVLTRDVILHELRNHDATRPYLPSSPYLDQTAYLNGLPSEDHLWGPRDYFKGDFYKNPVCHFASEIGYHGCNSPKSVEKFIPQESLDKMGTSKGCTNADWIVHASGIETATTAEGNPYAYRIALMISQVERIFTENGVTLSDFAMRSQISQAEADKYFIERFRIEKWRKTGIIWWNIIDGWPQISDAIVDYYGIKKLAYSYIKRSQQPFAMILGEPTDGKSVLFAVNDLQNDVNGTYTVKNLRTGEIVARGKVFAKANSVAEIAQITVEDHAFYLIEWNTDHAKGINHHACSLGEKWNFNDYYDCMKAVGFANDFEGF